MSPRLSKNYIENSFGYLGGSIPADTIIKRRAKTYIQKEDSATRNHTIRALQRMVERCELELYRGGLSANGRESLASAVVCSKKALDYLSVHKKVSDLTLSSWFRLSRPAVKILRDEGVRKISHFLKAGKQKMRSVVLKDVPVGNPSYLLFLFP